MFKRNGSSKNSRWNRDRCAHRLKKKQRSEREPRQRKQQLRIAAAALLLLLTFCSALFYHFITKKFLITYGSPIYEEKAEEGLFPCFHKLFLCYEIPGLEPPPADGRAWACSLFSMLFRNFTGIDLANPYSVLDRELGTGKGFVLSVATPSPSRGSNSNDSRLPPETEPGGAGLRPMPWGGSLFPFPLSENSAPKILLYHTHSSETFTPGAGTVSGAVPTVVTAGKELARILEENYGLPVLHHRKVYDQPRQEAYKKARPAIAKIIAENPSVELVVDLHRDGVARSRTTATVDARELASILLVHGCRNPGSSKSLELVFHLESELEAIAAPLSRGIMQQNFIYNQDLHPYAILIELGGHENSYDEALRSLPYLAEAIARTYYMFFLKAE